MRLREAFQQLLAENGSGEFPVKKMVEEVMTNTVKDEDTELPHVFTPETEYHLSSIFVDMQRPTVTFLFRVYFVLTLSMKIHSVSLFGYRGVMGPEASRRSASSPMVRYVSTRGILKKVIHGRNTLNSL